MKRQHCFTALLIAPVVIVLIAAMSAVCADRAYAEEEEEVFDNHWKVLTLIYQNVDTPEYKHSFTDAQVTSIRNIVKNLPDNYRRLSGGRFLIDSIDIETITEPITTITGNNSYPNWLTQGAGEDIDFDHYLDERDVDFVVVFAPVGKYPDNTWYGLGGTYYRYKGRSYNYAIINNVLDIVGKPDYQLPDGTYDTRLGALVHEMLHGIEANSRKTGRTGSAISRRSTTQKRTAIPRTDGASGSTGTATRCATRSKAETKASARSRSTYIIRSACIRSL